MKTFQNNEQTMLVEERFFGYDFNEDVFPGKDDIEAFNTVTNFAEYVYLHARRCGYSGDRNDSGNMASFVVSKCQQASVGISRQTIINWLTKGLPSNTVKGRENVYLLCFALQMDAQQTKEFFLKAYLERPFNYKDLHEAVFFFCFNNGLNYLDADRLISTIEATPVKENPKHRCTRGTNKIK